MTSTSPPRKDNTQIVREKKTGACRCLARRGWLTPDRVIRSIAGAWSYDTNKVTMALAQRERHKSITKIQSNIQKSLECSLLIHANTSILRNLNSVSAQSLTNQMRFCIYQTPVIRAQYSCTKVVMWHNWRYLYQLHGLRDRPGFIKPSNAVTLSSAIKGITVPKSFPQTIRFTFAIS